MNQNNNSLKLFVLCSIAISFYSLSSGCDKRKEFVDTANPEWAYDKPFYYKPTDGPMPLDNFAQPAPDIYINKKIIQIPRPKIGDDRKAPRVAIWVTDDNGIHWEKIGYFGLQQHYFSYPVEKDGTYGIRFIGPGIPPAKCKPPKPHMNFHVDTTPPEISVFISPDKEFYTPGDMITIDWTAIDENIIPLSAKISVCLDSESAHLRWDALGKRHHCIGSTQLVIPDEAIDKTLTIRITAEDKAGNIGYGYSCDIPVMYEPEIPTSTQPVTQPSEKNLSPSTQNSAKAKSPKVILSPEGPQVLTTMPADNLSDLLENKQTQKSKKTKQTTTK